MEGAGLFGVKIRKNYIFILTGGMGREVHWQPPAAWAEPGARRPPAASAPAPPPPPQVCEVIHCAQAAGPAGAVHSPPPAPPALPHPPPLQPACVQRARGAGAPRLGCPQGPESAGRPGAGSTGGGGPGRPPELGRGRGVRGAVQAVAASPGAAPAGACLGPESPAISGGQCLRPQTRAAPPVSVYSGSPKPPGTHGFPPTSSA